VVVGIAYALYAGADPEGWRLHLQFASERDDYQTTIWLPLVSGLEALGINLTLGRINVMATTIGGVALLSIAAWSIRHRPTLGEAAALGLTVFLLANKTFKPQYALWVLPLFALVSVRRRTVRLLELGVLIEFFAIYFSLPWAVAGIGAFTRILALITGAFEIFRRSERAKAQHAQSG
jgi:hypothetical protein